MRNPGLWRRRAALLATMTALTVLLPGCVVAAETLGKIVLDIGTEVVVQVGASSRMALFAALEDLGACRNIVGATAGIQNVADDRDHQINALNNLDVSALPNGASLRDTLLQALKFSSSADRAFVRWGDTQQSSCHKDDNYNEGTRYSQSATATKKQFVSSWNTVANTYGLPKYQESDI